jgi:ABC-type bacteriocin/lantibiotic exporter with double-glycine peptidase domain
MTDTTRKRRTFDWHWIGRAVLLRRRQTTILLTMTGALYAVGLVFPVSTQKAVDSIVAGHAEAAGLIGLAVAVLAASAIEAVLTRYRQTLVIDLATFIDRRIARLAFAHLMRTRVDGASFRTGETLNRFQQARKIQTFVISDVPNAVFELGSLVISTLVMFYYDIFVGVLVVVCAPLIVMAVRKPLEAVHATSTAYYTANGKQQNVLSETVHTIVTVKALAYEGLRMRIWVSATDTMLASLRHVLNIQRGYTVTVQLASRVLTLLVIALGCVRLLQGQITVGDLLALQMLAGRITGPLLLSSSLYGRYQEVNVAVQQIDAFLASPREQAAAVPPIRTIDDGGIVLRDVSMTYPDATRSALQGLDMVLPARGVIAVVGRNGSGKSTLIRILLGLNRDYTGLVQLGGQDLRDYDPRWLRSQIGVVDQDTVLFSGSIRANLSGLRAVPDAVLREALDFAGALDIVDALPGGLDAELTENGRTLSGGQRQRLSIARAVVRDPRVALFDEPAAFLDAEAAVALESRLSTWGRDRLLILVSHHLAATRHADRILMMDDGRLVGDGSHDHLLATVPSYASLWADYARNF